MTKTITTPFSDTEFDLLVTDGVRNQRGAHHSLRLSYNDIPIVINALQLAAEQNAACPGCGTLRAEPEHDPSCPLVQS